MNLALVKDEIYEYVRDELNDGIEFDKDANLIHQGLIDSMGVMKLSTFLEKRFGIEIELEDITAENFETLEQVSRLITRSGRL